MSFADLARQSGKAAVGIVEVYLDRCQHRYGEAPCTAAVPTTGATQCFNTFKTCQDLENYQRNAEPLTLHSEDLDNAYWTKTNVAITADNDDAPPGFSAVSDEVAETAVNAAHTISRSGSVTVSGRRVCVAVWVKMLTGIRNIGVQIIDTSAIFGGDIRLVMDPETGFLVELVNAESYRIENAGGGWWRVSVTSPIASGNGVTGVNIFQFFDGVTASYLGDAGVSALVFGGVGFIGEYATGYGRQEGAAEEFNNPMRIRFATNPVDGLQLSKEPAVFPTLLNADTAPTILTPGEGIGVRSTCSVTLQDAPFTDATLDPYRETRLPAVIDWNDGQHGGMLGRLVARNPNFENRRIDVLTGFFDERPTYDPDNFIRRTFIMDSVNGPDAAGNVAIVGKDPLKLADNSRRTCPEASRASLFADITDVQTIFEIVDPDAQVSAHWALGQTYLLIDGEVMQLLAVPIVSANGYRINVMRKASPSYYENDLNDQREHKATATVQMCWELIDLRVDDFVYLLLSDFCGIDDQFLPLTEWAEEIDAGGLNNYLFNCLITTPVGVNQLLAEVTKHNVMLWWDERRGVVRLRPVNFISLGFADVYNDQDNIVAGSLQTSFDMRRRLSQVWLYSGHRFPTKDLKPEYFAALRIAADLDRETPEQYGSPRLAAIASRFLKTTDTPIAVEVAGRLLRNYRDGKRVTSCRVDAKDFALWVGDKVRIVTKYVLDELGQPLDFASLIVEVKEILTPQGLFYELTTEQESTLTRAGLIAPNGMPDYMAASDAQRLRYVFIAPNSGTFPDGTPAYTIG